MPLKDFKDCSIQFNLCQCLAVSLRQIVIGHIHFVCKLTVFSSKCVNGREKCAEESKILCGCLTKGFVFFGLDELGQK